MTQLKPVSDLARRLLAKFGETPAQHQASVLALANKTYKKSHSTEKVQSVHSLNRQVEARLTNSLEPTAEVARRLETAKTFEDEWSPEAYVLFIRKEHCANCGRNSTCVDLPSIFLRHRRKDVSVRTDQTLGLPRIYRPIRAFAYPNLPKLKEIRVATLLYCQECFGSEAKASPLTSTGAQIPCPKTQTSIPSPKALQDSDETQSAISRHLEYLEPLREAFMRERNAL